jgi:hypothetical protein
VTEGLSPPEVFATLDDEYARDILVATKTERLSAKELSETCDMSRPTVSRRVNALVEQGLLDEYTHVDPVSITASTRHDSNASMSASGPRASTYRLTTDPTPRTESRPSSNGCERTDAWNTRHSSSGSCLRLHWR